MPSAQSIIERLEARQFLSAGQLDPYFGSGGLVQPQIELPGLTKVLDLQPLPDGRMVAAVCLAHPSGGGNLNPTVALVRLLRDGSADLSFGDGDALIDTGLYGWQRADLLLQADGRILLCTARALARFNGDGSFDSSFGSNGQVLMNASDAQAALTPDGRILVGGSRSGMLYAQRFNSDGSPDNSFNFDSVATVRNVGHSATGFCGFALMPNGTIYLGGLWTVVPQNDIELATQEFVIAHLRTNGTLDTAYGSNGTGIVTKRMTVYIGMRGQMMVEPTREKVLFGIFNDGNHMVFRYDRHGALDVTYGDAGVFNATPRTGGSVGVDAQLLVMEYDGAILAGGSGYTPVPELGPDEFVGDPALSRVTPDGQADMSFGADGRAIGHLPGEIPQTNERYTFAHAITFGNDGSIWVASVDRDKTLGLLRFQRDSAPAAEVSASDITAPTTRSQVIVVDYRSDHAIDTSMFDNRDLRVTGPDGYVAYAKFDRIASRSSDGRRVRARYKLAARAGTWDRSDNGRYAIRLCSRAVADASGHFNSARTIGSWIVTI